MDFIPRGALMEAAISNWYNKRGGLLDFLDQGNVSIQHDEVLGCLQFCYCNNGGVSNGRGVSNVIGADGVDRVSFCPISFRTSMSGMLILRSILHKVSFSNLFYLTAEDRGSRGRGQRSQ